MMYSWIRRRATFANVAMVFALVFAMSGGAYAAKKYLITSTSQISPKVLKKLKGKTGPRGVQGLPGPQGPAGAPGKDGANGVNGKDGANGTNGAAGESVTVASATASECKEGGAKFSNASGTAKACSGKPGESVVMKSEPSGANCTEGGESFTVGGKTEFACNGKEGKEGKEGSPWTAKGTLPEGSTEKGVWTVTAMPVKFLSAERQSTAISFDIPLAAGLPYKEGEPENDRVHIVEGAGEGKFEAGVTGKDGMATGCPTTSEANKPEAEPGNLCIFESFAVNVKSIEPESFESIGAGAGPWGTQLVINPEVATERIAAFGTWAVTA